MVRLSRVNEDLALTYLASTGPSRVTSRYVPTFSFLRFSSSTAPCRDASPDTLPIDRQRRPLLWTPRSSGCGPWTDPWADIRNCGSRTAIEPTGFMTSPRDRPAACRPGRVLVHPGPVAGPGLKIVRLLRHAGTLLGPPRRASARRSPPRAARKCPTVGLVRPSEPGGLRRFLWPSPRRS